MTFRQLTRLRPLVAGLKRACQTACPISKIAPVYKKGMGSLGRPRFIALSMWRGGKVAREAKALVPSAWGWAHAGGLGAFALSRALGWAIPVAGPVARRSERLRVSADRCGFAQE